MIDEREYRRLVDEAFARLDAAFEDVDPDLAESQFLQGTLTVTFKGGRRLIVSPQPPVQQIWIAFKDRAWHLDRDPVTGHWLDDRGQGLELGALVAQLVHDEVGATIRVAGSTPRV